MMKMAKEITCEIVKEYFSIDDSDDDCIKVCEVKWNGRKPKGYDIRKYDKEQDKLFKGLTISYDGMTDFISNAILNGLCDMSKIKDSIKQRESSIISSDDFNNLFKNIEHDNSNYKRDPVGLLRDKNNSIVIASKRKKTNS